MTLAHRTRETGSGSQRQLEKGPRTMTMKEKLEQHRRIEKENAEHLRTWKGSRKDPDPDKKVG